MPNHPSPTVRARRLSIELRKLRETHGLTIDQVVERSGGDFGTSAISRWEKGERRIRPTDLRVLLDIYGVDEAKREVLLTLAREARQRGWWHTYGTAIPPWFQFFLGLESGAKQVRTYESELVPGLLQTADYYRAFLSAAPAVADEQEIARKIEVREQRQARLTGSDPLELWAILNEATIMREVGGVDGMRAQLHHIAQMADLPNVTVQVLPFRAGAHPAMDGSFSLLEFPEPTDPSVAYQENQAGSLYIEQEPQVRRYTVMYQRLVAKALDPDDSRDRIVEVADHL